MMSVQMLVLCVERLSPQWSEWQSDDLHASCLYATYERWSHRGQRESGDAAWMYDNDNKKCGRGDKSVGPSAPTVTQTESAATEESNESDK